MCEAIVGIREDGIVRAAFAIDCADYERVAENLAAEWRKAGRTVKRCSWEHAMIVANKPWVDGATTTATYGRTPQLCACADALGKAAIAGMHAAILAAERNAGDDDE